MAENIQDKARAAVRQVIGNERTIHQCTAFDDSQGKSVTVRYEGVTETKATQFEAVKILVALKQNGFHVYRVDLFVTDADGKNVGSIGVQPTWYAVIEFETVGNKWRGTMPKDSNFKPDKPKPLQVIDEVAPLPKDFFNRASKFFRKFYGEKRIDGIALTPHPLTPSPTRGEGESNLPELPIEPGTKVDGNRNYLKKLVKDADSDDFVDADFFKRASNMLADDTQRNLFEGRFLPEDDNDAE